MGSEYEGHEDEGGRVRMVPCTQIGNGQWGKMGMKGMWGRERKGGNMHGHYERWMCTRVDSSGYGCTKYKQWV